MSICQEFNPNKLGAIKISKNHPVPDYDKNKKSRGRPPKYPFDDMEVGDSFLAEGQDWDDGGRCAANNHGRRKNKRFIARKQENGIRIWRVE